MALELRCDFKKHGEIIDGRLVVRCHSSLCGYEKNVVVEHRFSLETGELLDTKIYKEPQALFDRKKEDEACRL